MKNNIIGEAMIFFGLILLVLVILYFNNVISFGKKSSKSKTVNKDISINFGMLGSTHDRDDCLGFKSGDVPVHFGQGEDYCYKFSKDGMRDQCDKTLVHHNDKLYRCESHKCEGECMTWATTGWDKENNEHFTCNGPREGVKACKDNPTCSGDDKCTAQNFCDNAKSICCKDYVCDGIYCAQCITEACQSSPTPKN
jgi:hypothetical protein